MSITKERWEALIKVLEDVARFENMGPVWSRDARDILAMIDEDKPNPGTPRITFEPWAPPRPTLDKMPEGHLFDCVWQQTSTRYLLTLHDGEAWLVDEHGKPHTKHVQGHNPREFIVLDADPPQPKTLADVPARCWCQTDQGVCSVDGSGSVVRLEDVCTYLPGEIKITSVYLPEEIKIARVLGTLALKGGE